MQKCKPKIFGFQWEFATNVFVGFVGAEKEKLQQQHHEYYGLLPPCTHRRRGEGQERSGYSRWGRHYGSFNLFIFFLSVVSPHTHTHADLLGILREDCTFYMPKRTQHTNGEMCTADAQLTHTVYTYPKLRARHTQKIRIV